MTEISDAEMIKVIGDFIEMGHVENIVAMFRQDPEYYRLTGELLRDERFVVRVGMAVLFEELVRLQPAEVNRAIPALRPLLDEETPWMRGEAANLLAIINSPESLALLEPLIDDPEPQVAEIARDALGLTG